MSKVYLHATLKLKIGEYDRFCESMAKQIPVLEGLGWKLVGGWVTLIGQVQTIIDIWEIPDANAFFDVTEKWKETAAYKEFKAITAEVLEEEMLTMVKKVPYSP